MRKRLWTLFAVLTYVSGEHLMGGHLDNNAESRQSDKIGNFSTLGMRKTRLDDLDLDLVAEESAVAVGATAETPTGDNDDVPRYHIAYPFAFNGGKPFSLEKDPITGKIDFEKAPPVKALNYTNHYREHEDKENKDDNRSGDEKATERKKNKGKNNEDVSPNEINTYANFHDFLNLPVHYSSDKYGNDKYPLISSSYANTKVQSGANSYSTYNHKPYHPENDLYVRPVKHSYAPITKTSTHKTTAIDDDKVKWTSSSTITTPVITTNLSFSTSTKTPAVTTWKPPNTPIAFHSIDRIEVENEKNLLPIEKLHASGHAESHQNWSNAPMRTSNDSTMEKTQTASLHKDHSNFDNFVLSHVRPETKPMQNEEYDSYDTYELSDGESEDDNSEGGSEGNSEGGSEGNSEENDYFLPFKDLLKEVTSVSSTITSPTTSTAATTTTTVTASSAGTTTIATTTVMPSRFISSTPSALRKDAVTNSPFQFPIPQHPVVSSSLNSDQRQNITERYDDIIKYRPSPMPDKLEPNRIGTGTVIESTSNIVIPPDQDTVSFVLGNRQSVEGGYYSVGTAIGENPYGSLSDVDTALWSLHNDPHGPTKEIKYEHSPAHSVTELLNPNRVTQKWWPSNSLKTSNEIEPMKSLVPITSAVIQDMKNPSKEKDFGYVIFPDDKTKNKNATTEEHIVIVNEADGSIRELITSKSTTLTTTMATITTNKTKHNVSATISEDLPQLAEDLIPPAESPRPPSYYYHYQYDISRPDHSRVPQRSPLPPPPLPRIKPHSVPPLDAGLRKRPYSPDMKLPNILPQFRPNAKASHGHRGPDAIGTMPAGQGSSGTRIRQPLPSHSSTSRRPLLPPPPSYLQRLNPPPPPIHAVRLGFVPTSNVDNIALPHEMESTIRTKLRPSHATPSISRIGLEENMNKLFAHSISQIGIAGINSESRKEDNSKIIDERENEERYPEEPPMTPPRPPLFPKRRTADPPRVATLQMIQHHGELIDENDETDEPEIESMLVHEAEHRKSDDHDSAEIPEQPVYVVYPVNTAVNIHSDDSNEKDGSVVVGTRGPHRPLPPDTLLQNEPAEEAHTVYNGRPLVALDFPYPLERPDPTSVFSAASIKETPLLIPSKQRQQQQQQLQIVAAAEQENEKNEHVDAVNVIPYLQDFLPTFNQKKNDAISVTLHRIAPIATSISTSTESISTSTPIAYVYTPTHAPYLIHLDEDIDNDDENRADTVANVDAKQTVLLPSQQPSSSSSSAPAPQNFMAPFVASMSAEAPSKNGWSVVVVEPPTEAERKLDSDDSETKHVNSEIETQTERNEFNADNFKPQLFGGFKPIYEFPTDDAMRRDVANTNTEIDTPRHSKKLLSVPDKG